MDTGLMDGLGNVADVDDVDELAGHDETGAAVTMAPVFDVQRFSIHDGPGIRTLVFLKGCNLACAWCQNPESQSPRAQPGFYAERCRESGDCLAACEHGAIRPGGFRIDYEKCVGCLRCVDACAFGAIRAIGRRLTPHELMVQIRRDRAYYASSGGGVTFSGGEPTLYPRFIGPLVTQCRAEGIHTALETCGSFSFARWQDILRHVDLIYFDLKIIDPQRHRAATGGDNARILSNAAHLVRQGYPLEFRLPLVEGYTDDLANREAVLAFLRSLGQTSLHLLAYHNMGEAKIALIDGAQKRLGLSNYPAERLEFVRDWFVSQGIRISNLQGAQPAPGRCQA